MNILKKYSLILLGVILLSPFSLLADDIELKVIGKSQVKIGERFRITFELNSNGEGFTGPDFSGFRVLNGPSVSRQSGYQFVNGKTTSTNTNSYIYTLQALKEGTYNIKSATAKIGKKRYKSKPFTLKVVKANSSNKSKQNTSGSENIDYSKHAFLKAYADKKDVVVGEQIIISYKLYLRLQVNNYGINKSPSFNGFWSKRLQTKQNNLQQETEVIDGVQYSVYTIDKYAVFSQRSGEVNINPLDINITAQIKQNRRRSSDPFEDFFGNSAFGNYKNVEINLKSNELKFNVKNPPINNKPVGYEGLVGNYKIASSVTPKELNVNDAITYRLSFTGTGNLNFLQPPKLDLPPDFEVYDPKVVDNIKADYTYGITGSKTYEWVIIPKVSGEFVIPAFALKYYNSSSKKYNIKSSKAYDIKVNRVNGQSNSDVAFNGVVQGDIKKLGSDIRYIQTSNPELKPINFLFFSSIGFYTIIFIAIILLILFVIIYKKLKNQKGNQSEMRFRKANKVAVNRMKNAKILLDKNEETKFYDEVSIAIWGYLSDKFNIVLSDLSLDTVFEHLKNKDVKEDLIQNFIKTLQDCDYARFAPGDKSSIMNELYDEALDAIIRLEKELK